ncbi:MULTISPECIES: sigma-E factor negative regulatory protein [unclassified Dyella]|uniref:sigma-E factor negative regulatory protein n=1 Tax=unclassified Dyella TaxID=2634549 RepID=UPI000C850805|nr:MULTISPECIES: sigma-E factor negative regulatory protein [unclassified Dyella]MDR3445516.1 sigma-E factor negative regulatory protein [Dyella sp.]PMQ05258.1 Anti-sigma-E factor RseA [Dyella sp. AD56]
MTDNQRENLSAGMDGELSKEELRFLLRRLDHEMPLQQAWSRYHIARDGLRRELSPLASDGFAARVMLAIEQDGVAAQQGKRRHWLHWSAGGAIAAGVAVAALMVAQPAGQGADHLSPQVASTPSTTTMETSTAQAARSDSPAVAPPGLNVYSEVPYKISQQASATVDGDNSNTLLYSRNSLTPYRVARYPAVSNGDGSYLILVHPDQQQPAQAAGPQ